MQFGDLTILIGPQASGKTIALETFKLALDYKPIIDVLNKNNYRTNKVDNILNLYYGAGMSSIWQDDTEIAIDDVPFSKTSLDPSAGKGGVSETVFYIPAQRVKSLTDGTGKSFGEYRTELPFVNRMYGDTLQRFIQNGIGDQTTLFPMRTRLKGLVRLLRLLSKEDIGLVADLHNVLRSWLVDAYFRLRGCRVAMLDKGRKARLALLRERGSGAQHKAYTTRYFEVFRRLGFAVEPTFTTVLEHDTAQPDFTAVLPDAEKVAIGIAPFARYQNKTYPLQLMEQVVAQLSADGRFRVLLFSGGKHEREQMEAWQGRYPNTLSVAGRYSLDDEIRLMARVRVMVTMDSANMHLASLVGTPVVSVWGSTTPQCGFMGWGQQQAYAMLMGCDCQPCTIAGSNSCRRGDFRCLQFAPDALCRRIVSLTKLPL